MSLQAERRAVERSGVERSGVEWNGAQPNEVLRSERVSDCLNPTQCVTLDDFHSRFVIFTRILQF